MLPQASQPTVRKNGPRGRQLVPQRKAWSELNAQFSKKIFLGVESTTFGGQTDSGGWEKGSGLCSGGRLVGELELRGSEAFSKASPDASLRGKPAWYSAQ